MKSMMRIRSAETAAPTTPKQCVHFFSSTGSVVLLHDRHYFPSSLQYHKDPCFDQYVQYSTPGLLGAIPPLARRAMEDRLGALMARIPASSSSRPGTSAVDIEMLLWERRLRIPEAQLQCAG